MTAPPVWPGMLPGVPYPMMGMPLMDPNMMMPQVIIVSRKLCKT